MYILSGGTVLSSETTWRACSARLPALTGRHGTVRLVVVLQSLPVVCPPEACCPLGMGERDLKSESTDVTGPQQVADSLPVQLPKVPGPGRKLVPQAEVSPGTPSPQSGALSEFDFSPYYFPAPEFSPCWPPDHLREKLGLPRSSSFLRAASFHPPQISHSEQHRGGQGPSPAPSPRKEE